MTLEEAQMAKIDLALDKLGLQPGMTLLDIGCGWGSAMKRAIEKYDVNVIGLTLSKNQCAFSQQTSGPDRHRPLAPGIPAWLGGVRRARRPHSQHRGVRGVRKTAVRGVLRHGLPNSARRWPHGIGDDIHPSAELLAEQGISITMSDLRFMRFVGKEIFPGGANAVRRRTSSSSRPARGSRMDELQVMNPHYVRTLDTWAANLEARRDDAIAATTNEVYERYMRYLTGCADFFRRGITEVGQFTLTKR